MPNRRFTHRAMVVAATLAGLCTAAAADDDDALIYRVRSGDTLKLVAAEFYGDHHRTTLLLMVANKLQRQRKLIPGEKIRVPISRDITTLKGDTFESLAKTHLGDEGRAPLLAEFNGMSPNANLATGTALVIPLRVTHTAAGRETLAQISQWYFGDAKQVEMLRAYNHLATTQIEKDDTVVIPCLRIRVRADKLPGIDAASSARRAQRKQANADALAALPRARTAWLQADFAAIRPALREVASKLDFLEQDTAAEVGLLLGKADLAFNDTPGAVAVFRQVVSRQPRALSTYLESPKVIAAWQQAGGRVHNGTEPGR